MAKTPMKAIRAKCLDCCCGKSKPVKFCPCDGVHSPACPLWMFRFGHRPKSVSSTLGEKYVTPGALPPPSVPVEACKVGEAGEIEKQ